MEEQLSIQEKAKRYDEVSKEVKDFFEGRQKMYSDVSQTLEHLFPELKESEGERVRKIITLCLEECVHSDIIRDYEKDDVIAWLEKQGQKDKLIKELGLYKVKYTQETLEKHINSIGNKDDERLRKTTISFLKDFVDKGYENAVECIEWLEKQGEQKYINYSKQCADYKKDSELQMPRLTEFENELATILFEREYEGSTETEADIIRGRLEYELAAIRLSPKLLSIAIKEQKEAKGNDREIPNSEQKPNWKPSDEQMKQLGWIAKQNKDNMIGKELMTLYNDLKKIREEYA